MRMKKLLTFLTLLTLFFGVGWAETYTHTFASGQVSASGGNVTLSNVSWTASEATYIGFTNSALQIGSKNNPQTSEWTLKTSAFTGTISEIKINAWTGGAGTYAISVGGTSYKSGNLATSSTDITATGNSSGEVVISMKASSKAMYLKSITVTYTTGGSQTTVGVPAIEFDAFTAGKTTSTVTITPGENATSTSYKIGDGTYQTYSAPIEIDLTEVASPITVYAKSSDGTNESSEVSATFTVPALGLSISPASYTGYAAQTVTLTPSNFVGDYLISYTINGGTAQDYTDPFELSTPGTYEIEATVLDSRAGGTEVSKTATITINEAEGVNLPFVETFAEAAGTGPSGDSWSGTIAGAAFKSDNEGWVYNYGFSGAECARFGNGSNNGYATTPLIKGFTANNEYTLTFKAGAWNNDGTTLSLTASNGTFKDLEGNTITSVTMENNAWTDYTVIFVPSASTSTISFTSNNKRFFLDEVNVKEPVVPGDYYLVGTFNNWAEQDENYKFTANADGTYTLDGITLPDDSRFKIMKSSIWCGGPTDNSQYCEVTSSWHTNMGIIDNGGSDYHMANGGTCYFTINANNQLTVEKTPIVIRGSFDSWSTDGVTMTTTADGWTVSLTDAFAENGEFGFVDGWGQWHGGNGAWILEEYLGTALDMGTNGNYVVKVPGKYTISVNRTLTKMTADVARESHNITTVANPNGGGSVSATVNGSTATSAKYLDKVTINASADNGYTLSGVVVTGATSGNEITVTDNVFTMPDEDVTITATFVAGGYAITVVSPNGTTTCPATATVGQTVSFTVAPNEGYTVNTVTASFVNNNGSTTPVDVTENNGTYSFGMPPFPVTVTVTYTKQSSGGDGEWTLVTDASQLVEGNEYIIVVQNLKNGNNYLGSYALTTEVTQNYLKATNDIELGENYLTAIPGESVAIFTLEGSEDNWMFKNGENYLYNFNTSKNYLGLGTPENGEGVFSITIGSNNVASIVENEDSRGLYCLPNVSNGVANPYFSLYKNAQINGVHLYCRTTSGVAKPVINPASKVFTEEFDATITCSTQGATIYYTIDGTDPTTSSAVYSNPIHVDKTMTIKAIAAKDGEVSGIAEAVYQCTMVENIAEYLTLPIGTENIVFKNPVVVQYHYISSSGKSYIYVKDDTGCAYFHQPYETEGTPSMTQLENGDVIGARFYGDKDYDEAVGNNQSIYAMFTNLENFAATGNKALAEPELKTVSEIIATNAAELNNHYITIKKVKLSNLYQALSYGGDKYFDIYDETGQIGQDHIGYNKFNIDYASVVDDLDAYYNITGIFTAYNNKLEFHPTEIYKWAEKEVTLADLCENGEEGESYKITNNLQGVVAVGTSLWVKDENGQSIHKVTPTAPYTENFEVLADGNTRSNQADYDQSNWCEIVFPDATTAKSFENKIISGYSIEGVFNKKANPKLTLSANAQVEEYGTSDVYAPNYYLPANFVGSQSCNTVQYGQEGHGDFFFMTPKPQEYAQIVWAIYDGVKDGKPTFIISPDKNRNAHQFSGVFVVDLSMNTGVTSTSQITEGYGYDFTAIIRMVETTSSNAPSLKRQGDIQNDQSANYVVYPLDLDEGQNPATAINTVDVNGKAVKSVKYVNVAGMVSDKPFSGVNIVVTEYTDGSRTTSKMLRK